MEGLKQIYQYQRLPNLGWIVSPTYPMSLVPERMWKKLCFTANGQSLIAHERRGERAFLMWPPPRIKDRFYRVEIKTADDPDRLRGASIGWAILDEAAMMKPETFDILRGRVLDSGGVLILATTPRGKNWIYHEVYLRSLEDPKYVVVRGRTEDNPHLDPGEVADLYKKYASKGSNLAKQEMGGEFCDFEGLVFDHFRVNEHLIGRVDVADHEDVICGMDWGYNDPFCCVWLVKRDGVWIVADEYYKPHTLLADHASYITNHPLWPQVKRIWADPSGLQERKEFLKYGIKTLPARRPEGLRLSSWPVARARTINNLLSQRFKSPLDHSKSCPGLVFSDSITNGAREMMSLCYKNTSSLVEDQKTGGVHVRTVDKDGKEIDRNATEEIVDRDNHFVDALGYALFSEVRTLGNAFYAHYYDERSSNIVEQKPAVSPQERLRQEIADMSPPPPSMRPKQSFGNEPFDTVGQ